jgi:dipeptidyl aminopeptidase/acylaminoacyl peptidase
MKSQPTVRLAIAFLVLATPSLMAQTGRPRALGPADYERAERLLSYNTTPLVFGAGVRATWLADGRFWYRTVRSSGPEFVLVDPVKKTREPAFDHSKLVAALSAALGRPYDVSRLPFQQIEFTSDFKQVQFNVGTRRVACDRAGESCKAEDRVVRNDVLSPDGKLGAFIRDWNLWVREVATGKETQLTTDGVRDFGYATDNAGWRKSDRAVVKWSPDSKKLATFQQDQRGVGEMYLVDTRVGHPQLQAWKYPLPGDKVVAMIHRVIVDVERKRVVRLKMNPDQHRSTLCDDVICGGDWVDVQWNPDGSDLAFVSSSRDHKLAELRVAEAATGAVRDVLNEQVATFFESGNGRVNWRYLPASKEVIWFSQKDNWGHLYLHDLTTGRLKHQMTKGEGNVTQLLRVDEKARVILFQGVGKEADRDPYFRHLYRIDMDGQNLRLLTPDEADHDISLSTSGQYFTDSASRPNVPPVAVLRDADGQELMALEKADISKLEATGWQAPMPFSVKSRDGVTDLYGLLYRPTNFDSSQRYPIINQIYPGPQTGSVGSRSFSAARGDTQALAELGFVVVQIDGMGTPWRSKRFHEAYYGDMGDNTLPDQVTGMKQLAARFPWIDIDRAGIYGHSGGGFATAGAMFRYPDFFKVGVSQAGNHDNRVYEDDWGEKWQGLLEPGADGKSNYDNQANQLVAHQLKGKLLLAHGSMDNNVPFYSTLLVVNELIKSNKDFDLIIFPNRGHGFGNEPYMIRRRWDYFVRHLLGAEPPAGYELKPPNPDGPGAPPTPQG